MDNPQFKSFIEEHIQSLIQIYITERQSRGEGVLMITKNASKHANRNNSNDGNVKDNGGDINNSAKDNDKMDVAYLTASEMPHELLQDLLRKKKESHRPSLIYFYVCMSENESFWLEYDLDK